MKNGRWVKILISPKNTWNLKVQSEANRCRSMQIDANWIKLNQIESNSIKFNQIHSKNNLSNFENQQNPGFWGAYPSFIWERSTTDPARKRVFRRWLLPLSMNKNLRFSNVSTCWSVTPVHQRSPKTPIFPKFANMARFLTKKLKMRRGSKPKIWTSKLTFYKSKIATIIQKTFENFIDF